MVLLDRELAELFDPESELEQKTRMCLKDLQNEDQMVCTDLLHVVDENCSACEDLVRHWKLRTGRLRILIQSFRRELSCDSSGLGDARTTANALLPNEQSNVAWTGRSFFNDILSSLGFAPEAPAPLIPDVSKLAGQTSRPAFNNLDAAQNTADSKTWIVCDSTWAKAFNMDYGEGDDIVPFEDSSKEFRADIDSQMEQLEHGLQHALNEATKSLSELECLGRRLEKLRVCWPCLKESICRAYDSEEPFERHSLVWTFNEMLSWRRSLAIAFANAVLVGHMLQDSVERDREKHEESLRWRSMSQELLGGLEKAVAARAAAVLWLRGKLTQPEEAANALKWNLECVAELEHRLVQCVSTVTHVELEPAVVQQAVQRLTALKRDLDAKSEEVAAVRCKISNPNSGMPVDKLIELVCRVLRELLDTVDDVVAVLDNGNGYSGDPVKEPKGEEVDEFRAWIRNVLLHPGTKQRSDCSQVAPDLPDDTA